MKAVSSIDPQDPQLRYLDLMDQDNRTRLARLVCKTHLVSPEDNDDIYSFILKLINTQVQMGLKYFYLSNLKIASSTSKFAKPIRQFYIYLNLSRLASPTKQLKLVDVGCGRCFYKPYIEMLGFEYTGYDMNDSKDLTSSEQSKMFIDVDITSNSFDPIDSNIYLCTEVIEHIPEPTKLLNKICSKLHKDSTFILTMPYICTPHQTPYYFYNGFHPNYVKYIEKITGVETYSSSFFAHNETDIFQGYCLKAKG